MIRYRRLAVAVVCGLVMWGVSVSPVNADPTSGGGVRSPHQVGLTTHEKGCTEINVARASSLAAVRALVPERYELSALAPDAGRILVISYVCSAISVDGQKRAKPALVSLGAAQITSRDGVAENGAYLLWYGSSDPVLVARMVQLGIPAQYLKSASVEPYVDGQPDWLLTVPSGPLRQTITAAAIDVPSPVELDPPHSGLSVFYDAPGGDLRLEYLNSALSVGSTVLTGDLTGLEPLVPLIYRPALLTLNGSRFPSGFVRGDWTLEAQRLIP